VSVSYLLPAKWFRFGISDMLFFFIVKWLLGRDFVLTSKIISFPTSSFFDSFGWWCQSYCHTDTETREFSHPLHLVTWKGIGCASSVCSGRTVTVPVLGRTNRMGHRRSWQESTSILIIDIIDFLKNV
jgi:hypothetical protein